MLLQNGKWSSYGKHSEQLLSTEKGFVAAFALRFVRRQVLEWRVGTDHCAAWVGMIHGEQLDCFRAIVDQAISTGARRRAEDCPVQEILVGAGGRLGVSVVDDLIAFGECGDRAGTVLLDRHEDVDLFLVEQALADDALTLVEDLNGQEQSDQLFIIHPACHWARKRLQKNIAPQNTRPMISIS